MRTLIFVPFLLRHMASYGPLYTNWTWFQHWRHLEQVNAYRNLSHVYLHTRSNGSNLECLDLLANFRAIKDFSKELRS